MNRGVQIRVERALQGLIKKPPTTPFNNPPVWDQQPAPLFQEGVPSTYNVLALGSDPDLDTLTVSRNAAALPSGVTWDAGTGVLTYDGVGAAASTSGHVFTLSDGTDTIDSNSVSIEITDVFPNLKNVAGWYQIGSLTRILSDTTSPNYMLARVSNYILCQILTLGSPSGRAGKFAEWQALKADNPLFHGVLHSNPPSAIPAYRPGFSDHTGYLYRIARDNHNRVDACAMLDTDAASTTFNGNERTGFVATGATTFTPNFVTPAVRDDWAKFAADMLAGSDLSGFGFGGGYDLSDYMTWFHDSTNILFFGFNKKLMNPYTNGVGNVVSVDSFGDSTGTHLRSCTIDTQPGSVVEGKPIYFFSNTDPKGFIGYVIGTYTAIGGGQAQLTLLNLPGTATGVSQITVAANWKFTICNPDSTPDQVCDWQRDGTPEGKIDGPAVWVPAWTDMFDRIETHLGKASARGWNAIAATWDEKYSNGWASPHEFTATADNPSFENASRAVGFDPHPTTHDYNVKTKPFTIEKCMHGMYFLKSMRRSPNTFVSNKPYRPYFECLVEGTSHSVVSALDANMLRFIKALAITVGDMATGGVLEAGNLGVGIEEDFIDLDTGYTTVEPIADYDDAGGPVLSQGPQGVATMRTPTCGEAIYARRVGNWLLLINAADSTRSDYPSTYSVSHLGGYTPQAGNDEITAANWATIISTYLTGGEALRHYNPATYVNSRVTSWLQAQAPSHWTGFNFGPQQAHPNDADGTYTVANTPAIARDPTLNDGSVVDTSASYFIGPMQAVFLEIYTP